MEQNVMANVNHPKHYTQGGIECIEAVKAATINKPPFEAVLVGNTIKYLWRYEAKGGIEDVEKALWYLARLHKELVEKKMRYKVVADERGVSLETPWGTRMTPNEGDMFNQNQQARAGLLKALLERGGFCPCQPTQDRDTMCPCKTYRTEGKCICGMFTKVPQSTDTTKEEEPVEVDIQKPEEVNAEDVETESIGVDSETEDSKEQ